MVNLVLLADFVKKLSFAKILFALRYIIQIVIEY